MITLKYLCPVKTWSNIAQNDMLYSTASKKAEQIELIK